MLERGTGRGPKDHVNRRILHISSKAQDPGILKAMFCRILFFYVVCCAPSNGSLRLFRLQQLINGGGDDGGSGGSGSSNSTRWHMVV